jgi:hypothetical protein
MRGAVEEIRIAEADVLRAGGDCAPISASTTSGGTMRNWPL